jgi:hypothetical protein
MQRVQAIHERLQRWAVWHYTARVRGGVVAVSRWDVDPVDRANFGPGTLLSASDEEAIVTEQAVAALAFEGWAEGGQATATPRGRALLRVVREVYLQREGRTLAQTAAILHLTPRTLHNQLCDADRRVAAWLVAWADGKAAAAADDAQHAPHFRRALYEPAVD